MKKISVLIPHFLDVEVCTLCSAYGISKADAIKMEIATSVFLRNNFLLGEIIRDGKNYPEKERLQTSCGELLDFIESLSPNAARAMITYSRAYLRSLMEDINGAGRRK